MRERTLRTQAAATRRVLLPALALALWLAIPRNAGGGAGLRGAEAAGMEVAGAAATRAEEAAAEPPDTLWCIGRPDASARELGLTRQGYGAFSRRWPSGVRHTIGRSAPRDWPFVHPAPRDSWAGGRSHTFTIEWRLDRPERRPLWLVIGTASAHPSERSMVSVSVNGRPAGRLRAPTGSVSLVFRPDEPGTPRALVFPLPAGAVRAGGNSLSIRLDGGSWIIYDYVALRTVDGPLAIRPADAPVDGPGGRRALLARTGVDEVVFAVRKLGPDAHWYANIGYYAECEIAHPYFPGEDRRRGRRVTYRDGGRLAKFDVRTGEVTVLLDDPGGGVRDPAVHYDGETILFSYRPGGTDQYHLHTIRSDGTDLRRLTDGAYDDFEPCWLPDGGIVFVSTRARRWVNCWVTQVATLHRADGDGSNVRAISANLEHDNTPWVLPDGRILYQRWEYVDRSQVDYHHLWTTNPDGTAQMVYYGNQQAGTVMIDARPVPGSGKVVSIFSPGHGQREHDGYPVLLDPRAGPDDPGAVWRLRPEPRYRDPWAFSEEAFLVASGPEILFLDGDGRVAPLVRLDRDDVAAGYECHEPRPLVGRPREPVIPARAAPRQAATGRLVLSDVYEGRNLEGVRRGEIEKLLVVETLPKPINFTGGMDPLTYGGSFTLERVLGTVPVEEDGSAYLELPALRPVFFVALDGNGESVKRMQSFLTVQPGEVTGCVGCHEQRTMSPPPRSGLAALRRPASRIEPIPDVPDVLDFPRDIQPILDALCVDCHGCEATPRGGPYAGGLLLTGDRGPMFSHAYSSMTVRRLFSDGRNLARSNYPPRSIGSAASRILRMLDGSHHGVRASDRQRTTLRLWIDAGAPYPGTYAALGTGSIGGYAENHQVHTDGSWPTTRAGARAIERRCASCHRGERSLPRSLSDEIGISFWRFGLDDPRLRWSRHIVFNLSRPERSLLLLAPLAREAGGLGLCRADGSAPEPVFRSRADADYRALLAMVDAGRRYLETIRRFDMEGFRPRPEYIREMQRFGVLPQDLPDDAEIDPYATDRAYWRSLWHHPAK